MDSLVYVLFMFKSVPTITHTPLEKLVANTFIRINILFQIMELLKMLYILSVVCPSL